MMLHSYKRPPRFLQVTPSFELTSPLLTEDVVVDLVVQIWAATEERLAHMTRTRQDLPRYRALQSHRQAHRPETE